MESFNASLASPPTETWAEYPLVSPTKFLILCVSTFGLYGLWWQYKAWRFFKQWQRTDTWPVARAIFSLFTFYELLETINRLARHSGGNTPLANPGGVAAGYVILSLLSRLPDPLGFIALGASYFVGQAYRAFRGAMLQAPAYGGYDQENFSTRQVILLAGCLVLWSLALVGLTMPD